VDLEERYEKEITQLEKDATAKLNDLRSSLDKAPANMEKQVAEVKLAYDKQKHDALIELMLMINPI